MTEPTPFTVLLLDADPRSLNVLSAYLTRRGLQVTASTSGKEGYITALRDHPQAIVFDPSLPDLPGVELTRRLRADRRSAKTLLVALASRPDTELMTALASAGCNEFIVKSAQALEQLSQLLQPTKLPQAEDPPAGGLLVVFLSAKGGVGASSLCANIAQNIANLKRDLKVAVMDMVLPIGSIASIVGYQDEFGLEQAAAQPAETLTSDFLRKQMPWLETWRFSLLAGSPDPEAASRLDAGRIPALILAARQSYDITLVDLGRSLSRISLPVILGADVVALILSAESSAVTLSRKVWEHLQAKGLKHQRIYPILNRVVGLEGMSKSEAENLLGLQIRATVPYMMGNFTLANQQHQPVLQRFPNDTAALMVNQISREIIELARQGRA